MSKGTIDAEAYTENTAALEVIYIEGGPGLFQQNNARFDLSYFQQHCFTNTECVCLTGLPTIHIRVLLKMYGASKRGQPNNNQ